MLARVMHGVVSAARIYEPGTQRDGNRIGPSRHCPMTKLRNLFPVAAASAATRLEVLAPGWVAGTPAQGHSVSEVSVPEAGEAAAANLQGDPQGGAGGPLPGAQGSRGRLSVL